MIKLPHITRRNGVKIALIIIVIVGIAYTVLTKTQSRVFNFWRETVEEMVAKGDASLETRHYQDALAFYSDALKNDTGNAAIYLKIAEVYRQKNSFQSAFDIVSQGLKNAKNKADLYRLAGDLQIRLNNPEKAREYLLLADTTNPEIHFLLGQTYFLQSNFSKAQPEFATYTQKTADPEGIYYLGLAWVLVDPAVALPHFEEAAAKSWSGASSADSLQAIVSSALKSADGNYRTTVICHGILSVGFPLIVIDPLRNVVNQNPTYRDGLLTLGAAYFALGNYNEALAYFNGAFSLDPTFAETSYLLGRYYLSQSNRSAAEEYLMRATVLNPLSALYHRQLAQFYEESAPEKAPAEWRAAIETENDIVRALQDRLSLTYLYVDYLSDIAEAQKLSAIIERNYLSDNALTAILESQIRDVLAWVKHKSGDSAAALEEYKQLTEAYSYNPLSWYHRGRVEESLNNRSEAKSSFTRALDLDTEGAIQPLIDGN